MLTHARLLELVHYDPATGIFTAKVARKQVKAGQRLGTLVGGGYLACMILSRMYKLHRLAWFYMTGQWPVDEIDHRNRKKADNRWRNLREATRGQNQVNWVRANKTGFRGVHQLTPRSDGRQRYQAKIRTQGVSFHLGVFDTPEEASAAYIVAAKAVHGEFAEHLT